MSAHDLVIRNAIVVDGTGGPTRVADVAVSDGLITDVEPRVHGRGRREIEADDLTLTPGFVDIHTHFDGQATWDPVLAPSSIHGVTSIVMGNCGVGFAPARPTAEQHDWLIGMLEGVEDIPGTALAEGLTWDWETFPDYMDALARRSYAIDVATQVAHAPLRAYVMGERGADPNEAPTVLELDAMARMVQEGMRAGALGFTTSRTYIPSNPRWRTARDSIQHGRRIVGPGERDGRDRNRRRSTHQRRVSITRFRVRARRDESHGLGGPSIRSTAEHDRSTARPIARSLARDGRLGR